MRNIKPVYLLALAAFLIPMIVYLLTLTPTFSAGDGGELVTAAYFLGIPHPPGYPLFCLLGHLFIKLIPFGNAAWRVNVMSAFFASSAGLFLFLIFRKLLDDDLVSLVGALLFCFSRTFWGEAIATKFYTINIFFTVLVLWLALQWAETKNKFFFFLMALFSGMAVVAHQTSLMILPVLFFWAIWSGWGRLRAADYLKMVWLILLGLSLYLYLWIRSFANPPINWGIPQNLFLFLAHIFRWQYYGVNPVARTLTIYLKQIYYYLDIVSAQWPYVFFAVIGLGMVYQFQKNAVRALVFTVSFIMSSVVLIYFTNYDTANVLQVETQYVFYLISFLFLAVWLGFGFQFLTAKVKDLFNLSRPVIVLFFVMVVFSLVMFNLQYNQQHKNYIAYDYGKNLLRSCRKDSILWVTGDVQVFSVCYVKKVENLRPDLTVYDSKRIIFGDQYGYYLWPVIGLFKPDLEPFSRQGETQTYQMGRPVYYGWYKQPEEMPGYQLNHQGLVLQVFPRGKNYRSPDDFMKIYEKRGLWDKNVLKNFLSKEIVNHYEKALIEYLLVEVGRAYLENKDYEKAQTSFMKAIKLAPDLMLAYEGLAEVAKIIKDQATLDFCSRKINFIKKMYGYQ